MARRFLMIKEALQMKMHCNCTVCGGDRVAAAAKKPLGPFVKDGPTVLEMKCRRCGHKWRIPLRVGP